MRAQLEEIDEIGPYIKVHLPKVNQPNNFGCGPFALQAICKLYDVGPKTHQKIVKDCNTTPIGTPPPNIIKAARSYGLSVIAKTMTIDDLKYYLDLGRPIICCIQAHGDQPDRKLEYQNRQSGHYVTVCGYDKELIYVEDSMMKYARGFLNYNDFNERWHDEDAKGKIYDHYGMVIWKKSDVQNKLKQIPQAKKIP